MVLFVLFHISFEDFVAIAKIATDQVLLLINQINKRFQLNFIESQVILCYKWSNGIAHKTLIVKIAMDQILMWWQISGGKTFSATITTIIFQFLMVYKLGLIQTAVYIAERFVIPWNVFDLKNLRFIIESGFKLRAGYNGARTVRIPWSSILEEFRGHLIW